MAHNGVRTGFLGPPGTFTEQALLTQPDLAAGELVPLVSIPEVLAAAAEGAVDLGFVPIENAIEGAVNLTLDELVGRGDLLVQREVVMAIGLDLLAPPGARLADIRTVVSIPVAIAQVRGFLARELPAATVEASNSTAEAAETVGKGADPTMAAVGPRLAAELYGLAVLAEDIEDHPENSTRFVAVARSGVPAPTGHDKTTIVCFQHVDRPGSLLAILQEFAARAVNLVKLESRPTQRGLGHYCFVIDLEGHVADEVVGDALRVLKAEVADVRFLGSYPAAGERGEALRRDADEAWRAADAWLHRIRSS